MNTEQKAREWLKKPVNDTLDNIADTAELITALLKENEALLDSAKKYFHYHDKTFCLRQDIKNLQVSREALRSAISLCEKEHDS